MYRIGNWINEGSGWIVELIESQYIKISSYRPLSRSSYVQLPVEFNFLSSKKELIGITNKDQKCFLWCYVRHVNPVKINPERITREDKELVNDLDYDGVGFPVREKDFTKIKTKNNTWINVYCYENKLTFPVSISDQKFKKPRNLLLVIDENKSYYVHIKTLTDLFIKQRIKTKKCFCKSCLQCFCSKNLLTEHKEVCLSINGTQSVRLEKGTIEFKKLF